MWVARAAVVAVLALSVAACSSSPGHPAAPSAASVPSTGGTTASAAPISAPITAVPTTAPPTPTTEALVPQVSPDVAARSLFDAWSKGDRVGALHVATPAAVAVLFGHPVVSYSDRGCQDPISDRALCAFGIGDGLAQVGTVSLARGWVVETVTLE